MNARGETDGYLAKPSIVALLRDIERRQAVSSTFPRASETGFKNFGTIGPTSYGEVSAMGTPIPIAVEAVSSWSRGRDPYLQPTARKVLSPLPHAIITGWESMDDGDLRTGGLAY